MRLFKILVMLLLFISVSYANEKPINILIFQSYGHTLPWSQQLMKGIKDFTNNSPKNIKIFIETIDYVRLKKQMKAEDWKAYLDKKYSGIQFDGIIIETMFSSVIFESFSNELYLDVPKIYLADIKMKKQKQKNILIGETSSNEMIKKTIALVKKQNKNLKNIYIIEPYFSGKSIEKEILEELSSETFSIHLIKDFTMDELKIKLSNLPQNSVVFYILNFQDNTGKKFVPKDFLEEIVVNANAPIYSFWSTFLGTGTIGGYMTDGETAIQEILKSLLNYIHHDKFINKIETFNLFIDFNILKKYGINEKRNPKNAIIVNKPIPIWENYPKETLFALSTIILLSILLILTFILKIRNERISKMEDSMFIQSKQAAMGEMISVIAHQWRQPLNNISIMVQTILLKYQRKTIDETIMKTFKTDIFKQIKYMSNTVDDFKDFYKPNKQKIKFDIKQELIRTIELIENTYIQDGIKIEKNLLNNFNIEAYPNEISHCFLILLQNAKDALKESDNAKKVIQISIQTNKNECIISFKNNGKKIPINIKDKIFKPYFSTKKEKNGTGIGLYMAKTIIEKHFNGSIKVTNTLNGVNFEIRIVNVR